MICITPLSPTTPHKLPPPLLITYESKNNKLPKPEHRTEAHEGDGDVEQHLAQNQEASYYFAYQGWRGFGRLLH